MNKKLLTKIEKKIGRQILKRGDCQYLSDRIFNDINKNLSYNTIRRIFGLESNSTVKASISTLNLLSNFVGSNSYDEFNRDSNYDDSWHLKIKICAWINHMSDDDLTDKLNLSWENKDRFAITFVSVMRELLLLEKVKLVNDLVLKSKIDIENLNYSELVFIGNGIGSVLRKIKITEDDLILLLNNKFFVDYIFLLFVDYSSLNSYYGQLHYIAEKEKIELRLDQKLFFQSINNFRNILLKKEIKLINYLELVEESFHPILIGRLASIEIAACENNNISYDYVLNDISDRINNSREQAIDYLYEIKSVALLIKDFSLLQWIYSTENDYCRKNIMKDNITDNDNQEGVSRFENIPYFWYDDFLIQEEYHLAHQQYSYIVQLILAIKNNEVNKIPSILKRINKEKWVLSYHSYLSLFFIIIHYHLAKNKSKKNVLFNKYMELSKNLNYPIFDTNYLINYFN